MTGERLIYLPLGGAGEVGMNAYVYGWGRPGKERLIAVDLGVTFGDMATTPGIELIMPDISWLAERADRLEAIFITHAHEDHVGALGHLWPRLRVPVHARPFTAAIARLKLEEARQPKDAVVTIGPRPEVTEAGPFRVQFVPLSHSIPESAALVIDTPAGRIVHTADFKIDTDPVVGEPWDDAMWRETVAERPVRALMCDSTNIFAPAPGRSESSLAGPLRERIAQAPALVVATTFGSNVARLKTLAEAGVAAGRTICVMGRSMKRMLSVARETGVLGDFPPVVPPEEAVSLPRSRVMLLVTGSQGERRAAAAALSRGRYLGFDMNEGDTFLFSSRVIPGNERDVIRIWNALSERGVTVVDEESGHYHVSGHANRPDLEHVHRLIAPAAVVPMHGEHRHLAQHVRVAREGGFAAVVATNGTMLDLTGEAPVIAEHVETGRLYLDGSMLIGATDGVVRERVRMAQNGHVLVTVILDSQDVALGEPWADLAGLPARCTDGASLQDVIESELAEWIEGASRKTLRDDARIEEGLRQHVRQVAIERIGKKPEVTVVISRLEDE